MSTRAWHFGYAAPVPEIRVTFHIKAPVSAVFEAVSDHETFLRSRDVKTTIVRAGDAEKNGLGCLREVHAGRGVRFVEEITGWQRPTAFEYTIRTCTLPIRHDGARITFTERDGGTDIDWRSTFRVPVPILAPLLGAIAKRTLTKAFLELLGAARTGLESRGGAT